MHTPTRTHAQNLFSYLFLFCSAQWQRSHSQPLKAAGISNICRLWRWLIPYFKNDCSVGLWGDSFYCSPKATGWLHLVWTQPKWEAQSQRGACLQALLSWTPGPVPAMNAPCSGWNMVSWNWLLFLPSQTQWETSGAFITHRHKGSGGSARSRNLRERVQVGPAWNTGPKH